jgi:hypothetical protein
VAGKEERQRGQQQRLAGERWSRGGNGTMKARQLSRERPIGEDGCGEGWRARAPSALARDSHEERRSGVECAIDVAVGGGGFAGVCLAGVDEEDVACRRLIRGATIRIRLDARIYEPDDQVLVGVASEAMAHEPRV